MTIQQIRDQLVSHFDKQPYSARAWRDSKEVNDFPICKKVVYQLFCGKKIPDSSLWKMQEYFKKQQN